MQTAFGWGTEDVEVQITSMAAEAIEATYCMGDDSPLAGKSLLIYICNFHVLSHLLLIYIRKLHWNLNTMLVFQVNPFWFTYVISMF
jgi:Glutamate synthase central domain